MKKHPLPLFLLCCLLQTANAQFGTSLRTIITSDQPNAISGAIKFTFCDYDADGRTDLVATSPTGATGFRSDGSGSFHPQEWLIFEDLAALPTGFFGAQYSDLDADGLPDLAVGKSWRKNLGSGNFAPQQPVFEQPLALVLDIDDDNLPDALLTDSMAVFWQKNLGGGQFGVPQILKNADHPLIFQALDFNFDGKTDFLVRQNDGGFWYKNLGGGNFEAVQLFPGIPENMRATDMDGDGKMDLIFNIGLNIEWQEYDSTGQATPLQTISTKFKSGKGFALGDLTADGFPDLLVGGLTTGHSGSYFKFDAATGKFASATTDPTPGQFPGYGYAEIADLDGDGKNDYCTALANQFPMCWFRQISPGAFSTYRFFQVGLNIPKSIVSLDYDADGDLDLVSYGPEPSNTAITTATLAVNLGNQNFEKRSYPGGGIQSFSGDLDGDGLTDRAFYAGNDSIYWQKLLGNNLWGARKALPGLVTSCKRVAGGDLDNDGDIDLFAANGTDAVAVNARFYWFENDGAGHFEPHLIQTDLQLCSNAFPLDVNEDGWLDMVLYFFNASAKVYKNLGGGQFAAPDYFFPQGAPSPNDVNQSMLIDLDADGRRDFVYITKNWSDQKIAWYRNLGAGEFSEEKTLAAWSTNASWATNYFTVFDATGDGLPDIVISDNYWGKIRLIKGLGSGAFSPMSIIYDETQPFNYGNFFAVVPFDVNEDGKLDIVFGKRSLHDALPNYLVWLENTSPAPKPQLVILNQYVGCEDNGTPADPTDDIRVLKLLANNPTDPGGRYFMTEPFDTEALDTFTYNLFATYRWAPGSAGNGVDQTKWLFDLSDESVSNFLEIKSVGSCSFDAPPTIGVFNPVWICWDNNTPDDASDDFLSLSFKAEPQNVEQPSEGYSLSCNLGPIIGFGNNPSDLKYGTEYYFQLPSGSVGQPGPVTFTLTDKADPGFVQQWGFDNPCLMSATSDVSQLTDFQVIPNPVSAGQMLRLPGFNDAQESFQVQVLAPDGRMLGDYDVPQVSGDFQLQVLEHWPSQFFVRVSGERRSATRLVFKR